MSCATEYEGQFPQRSSWTTAGRKLWAAVWEGVAGGVATRCSAAALAACGRTQNYVMFAAL